MRRRQAGKKIKGREGEWEKKSLPPSLPPPLLQMGAREKGREGVNERHRGIEGEREVSEGGEGGREEREREVGVRKGGDGNEECARRGVEGEKMRVRDRGREGGREGESRNREMKRQKV